MALASFFLVSLFLSPLLVTGRYIDHNLLQLLSAEKGSQNSLKNEMICSACSEFSDKITIFLDDTSNSDNLIDTLNSYICQKLPQSTASSCQTMLNSYIPDAFSILSPYLSYESLCINTYACPSEMKIKSNKVYSKCLLCEAAAEQVLNSLQKNETQAEILQGLYSICSKVKGGSVVDACENLVDSYFPDFLEMVSTVSPSDFCSSVGYCSTLSKIFDKHYHPRIENRFKSHQGLLAHRGIDPHQPGDCLACKMMVAYFRNKIKDADTQEKFKAALLESCNKFPNYVKECQDAVEQYLPTIFDNSDAIFNSTVICQKTGACPLLGLNSKFIRLPSFRI